MKLVMCVSGVVCVPAIACAQFQVFEGGNASEAAWRAAAGGNVPMETFESFQGRPFGGGPSDAVTTLPALGIRLEMAGGAHPGVYADAGFAHSGINQLANFGAGGGQFSDYEIYPLSGRVILSLGFWQCDPQGDQPMVAYDAAGHAVGTIIGHINFHNDTSFAGFVSGVPILHVHVDGSLGDGWNHIDDLQIVTVPVCVADVDDGSGTGTPDGGVTIDDLLYYLGLFAAGNIKADVDDGSGTGTRDQGVTIDDLLYFLVRFANGC